MLLLVVALAGPAGAQPAPPPLSLLDVPFISQSEALCGGAAAAMVLRYWGERGLTADDFAHLVDRSVAGIRTPALVQELRSRGWDATAIAGTDAIIANELSRGRPVLTLIEDRPGAFHYIVIVGATPQAIVFHDPARAPMRVMGRDEFTRRWQQADRWMAIVVPGASRAASPAAAAMLPADPAQTSCEARVADGIRLAQDNDLEGAERSLTGALACPGAAAIRELAGVRVLQQRWADVESLAAAAVQLEPQDAYAWRLLGTSRFLRDDRPGALEAWNRAGEPRVDLVAVSGLTRTRQRVVERLLDVSPGEVLTPGALLRTRRRLEDLPSAVSTRLEYVPVPSALAEVRATVNERPLVPTGIWSYAAIGAVAAARRELEVATGSLSGGGERLTATWRFWPDRPRAGVSLEAPAPWGGTWGLRAITERQPFDAAAVRPAERTAVGMHVANWASSIARVSIRGGFDRWAGEETLGVAGAGFRMRSRANRVDGGVGVDVWAGGPRFSVIDADIVARSSTDRRRAVLVARGGIGLASRLAPLDLWFGGDTGAARDILLRAHPIVEDGALRSDRLGRRIAHLSLEAQRWWPVSVARVAAAIFVDAARVGGRLTPPGRGDVDAGLGARLAIPGLSGTFRADLARGLRDGATRLSFVYQP